MNFQVSWDDNVVEDLQRIHNAATDKEGCAMP
jgi:hypothetical protein